MRYLRFFILIILFASCKNNDEKKLLYEQLKNYKESLKNQADAQEFFFLNTTEKNEWLKTRYDSLNKIENKLKDSFKMHRYHSRDSLLVVRDKFNKKFKLNLELISSPSYKNISDSVFNKLIEIEFLRLKIEFQNRYMYIHKCI